MAERARLAFDALAKALQPAAQDLVVIAPARIAGDVRLRPFARRKIGARGCVAHAAGDDAQRPGLELCRPRAERAVPGHILHFPMASLREPVEKARLGSREIGVGDADALEAELLPPIANALDEHAVVHGDRS